MAGADGKVSITIRLSPEVHNRLQRLFQVEGPRYGPNFRRFLAGFLAEHSASAEHHIEIIKRSLERLEREPPPPPPLPKKK